MIDISRHRELINTDSFKDDVHVIGVGATGSFVAYMLAKLGIKNIHVYDYDVVEEHNVANQIFGLNDVGKKKIDALKERVLTDTGIEIITHDEKITDQRFEGYVFIMVDSMASRKEIYTNCIKLKTNVKHAIEPRTGLDMMRVYNISPLNVDVLKAYEETLYGDDVAEVSACGSTMSIISSSFAVASWCVRQLINKYNEVPVSGEILVDFKFNNMFTAF